MDAPRVRVSVSPADLQIAAESMRDRATDFLTERPPEVGAAGWPSQQAVRDFHDSVHDVNRAHHRRQRGLADSVAYAADNFTVADAGASIPAPSGIRPQDAAAMITAGTKDIIGAFGAAGQALASGVGALGSAAVSGLGAAANAAAQVGSVMVGTGAKLAAGDAASGGHSAAGSTVSGAGDGGAHPASDARRPETHGTTAGSTSAGGSDSMPAGVSSRDADARVRPAEASLLDAGRSVLPAAAGQTDAAAGPAPMMSMGAQQPARDKTYTSKLVGKKLFNDHRDDAPATDQTGPTDEGRSLPIAFARPSTEVPDANLAT